VGVGVVGLVTIVGLSDLLFLLPQQTTPNSLTQTQERELETIPDQSLISSTTPLSQDEKLATGTLEFSL
jgi:hypothetical protein